MTHDLVDNGQQRITIREVYQSVEGMRREMALRIDMVEKVGTAERQSLSRDLDGLKGDFGKQANTVQAQFLDVRSTILQVDTARKHLEEKIMPIIDYISRAQDEEARRERWRTKTFNFVFGAGAASVIGAACAVLALLHALGVF